MTEPYFGVPQSHTSQQGGSRPWGQIPEEQDDDDEDVQKMDTDEGDRHEPTTRNPVVAFREECSRLVESCPAAEYSSGDGMNFCILIGKLPPQIKDKFEKVDVRIVRATTGGYDENVTNYIISLHLFAVPVHMSPLLALIERVPQATFTDSITSMRQLLFFYLYFYKVALDNAEYCKLCRGAYVRIINDIDDDFFHKVDQICAGIETYKPEDAAVQFGIVMEEYCLKRIRAVEWTILDMLGIPLRFREGLMTPSYLPGSAKLSQEQGTTLRKNLCFYVRKRKEIFGGGLKILDNQGLLVDGIRLNGELLPSRRIKDENSPTVEGVDGPNMEIEDDDDEGGRSTATAATGSIAATAGGERTYQADILQVLTLEADFQQPANPKFKGYVCIKTLYNYLMFLNTPKEKKNLFE